MATVLIQNLTAATTPLTGAELIPLVQGGITKQTAMTNTLAQPYYARTAAEIAAGVTPTNYGYPDHVACGVVLPQRYGATMSQSNEYTALNNAMLVAEQAQCPVGLRGTIGFSTDLVVPRNVGFIGLGENYGGGLYPLGSARIKLWGSLTTGGFAFRNLFKDMLINCDTTSAANVLDIDTAYNVVLDNVLMPGFGTTSGNVRAIKAVSCNDLELRHIVIRGVSPTFAGQYGIELGTGTTATLYDPDIESCNRCIYLTGTPQVDIFGGYFERYSAYCIYFGMSSGGKANVHGGTYSNVNSGAVAMYLPSGNSNVNIFNPRITLNSGTGISSDAPTLRNVNLFGFAQGDVVDSHNAIRRYGGTNISNYWDNLLYNKKTQADTTVTVHYTATLASASFMFCELTVAAILGGGYSKDLQTYRFIISCPAGTAEISTIQVVGTAVDESSSANYGVTLTISGNLSTNTCQIRVAADTTGALGNGQTCDVFTELRVRCSSQSSYIDTN